MEHILDPRRIVVFDGASLLAILNSVQNFEAFIARIKAEGTSFEKDRQAVERSLIEYASDMSKEYDAGRIDNEIERLCDWVDFFKLKIDVAEKEREMFLKEAPELWGDQIKDQDIRLVADYAVNELIAMHEILNKFVWSLMQIRAVNDSVDPVGPALGAPARAASQ